MTLFIAIDASAPIVTGSVVVTVPLIMVLVVFSKIGTVEFRDHRLSSVLSRRAGYWYGSYDMAGGVRQPPCQ